MDKTKIYNVVAGPDVALAMKASLGNGVANLNGDRTSGFFVIAIGREDPSKQVKVELTERIIGQEPGEQAYLFHVIDQIKTDGYVTETDEFSGDGLQRCMKQILDSYGGIDKGKYTLVGYPALALEMKELLGNGSAAGNDRASGYFIIATSKGDEGSDLDVSADLIEHTDEIPDGKAFYSFHVDDSVSGEFGITECTNGLSDAELIAALTDILAGLGEESEPAEKVVGDEYKVQMLQRMLAHETDAGQTHYGACLMHDKGDCKPLLIDAGGLRALIEYYKTHETNLG